MQSVWKMYTCLLILLFCFSKNVYSEHKPRVIVTTDGESDDKCSFVRYLLYSNHFDTEGLIYVNSKHHKHGEGTEWMQDLIEKYSQVYDNLLLHDRQYPSPKELLSVVKGGNLEDQNMNAVGPNKDTEGSNHIVSVLLNDDPRPVWVLCWGGINTLAQALYRIKTSHPDRLDTVNEKMCIHAIAGQEDSADGPSSYDYIGSEFPDILFIQEWQYMAIAYDHRRNHKFGNAYIFSETWLNTNVKTNHGPLGASYYRKKVNEGDSPSFIYLIPTGLRSTENPGYGGWGGRYKKEKNFGYDSYWPKADPKNLDSFVKPSHGSNNFWTDEYDDGDRLKPIWRWVIPMANDFEARLDWCVKDYKNANHPPVVKLGHSENLTVDSGDTVRLNATGTYDPDDDRLFYEWWQYKEPGNYDGCLTIMNAGHSEINVLTPIVKNSKMAHIILEVTDSGKPNLTRYRRIILTINP